MSLVGRVTLKRSAQFLLMAYKSLLRRLVILLSIQLIQNLYQAASNDMNFKSLQDRLEKQHLYHPQVASKPLLDSSLKVFNENKYIYQCKELTSANNTLRSDLIELIKENNQLKNKLRWQHLQSQPGEQLQRLKMTVDQLSQQLHQLRPRRHKPEINIVEDQELQLISLQLQNQNRQLKEKLDLAEKQIIPLEELTLLLKNQNEDCSNQIKDLNLKLAALEEQNQRLISQQKQSACHQQRLKDDIKRLKEDMQERQEENQTQRSEMHSSFSLQIAKLSLQNDQKNSSIQRLQAELELTRDELSLLKNQSCEERLVCGQLQSQNLALKIQHQQSAKVLIARTKQLEQSQTMIKQLRQQLSIKEHLPNLKVSETTQISLMYNCLHQQSQLSLNSIQVAQSNADALKQEIKRLEKELQAEAQLSRYTSQELQIITGINRELSQKASLFDDLLAKLGGKSPSEAIPLIQSLFSSLDSHSRDLGEMRQLNLQLKQQLELFLNIKENSFQAEATQCIHCIQNHSTLQLAPLQVQHLNQLQLAADHTAICERPDRDSSKVEEQTQQAHKGQLQRQLREVRKASKSEINQLKFRIEDLQISNKRVKALEKQNETLRKELESVRRQSCE